jgi:predicted Zn-dependent protease with MMP-like domain
VLSELPAEIGGKLSNLMITLEKRPTLQDADEALLGLFIGTSYGDELADADPQPPRIRLFVENIREEVENNPSRFRQEVRTTLLHEIGHYLGWGEAELESRGLG